MFVGLQTETPSKFSAGVSGFPSSLEQAGIICADWRFARTERCPAHNHESNSHTGLGRAEGEHTLASPELDTRWIHCKSFLDPPAGFPSGPCSSKGHAGAANTENKHSGVTVMARSHQFCCWGTSRDPTPEPVLSPGTESLQTQGPTQ